MNGNWFRTGEAAILCGFRLARRAAKGGNTNLGGTHEGSEWSMPILGAHMSIAGGYYKAVEAAHTEAIQREVALRRRNAETRKRQSERDKAILTEGMGAWIAEKLGDISRLPTSLKVLLENLLRWEDDITVRADDFNSLASWLLG